MKSMGRRSPVLVLVLCIGLLGGCNRGRSGSREAAYVSAPQANLRDQVAAAYTKVGIVKNGERVEVLDRDRRFVKVRTSAGVEGWVEQRYVVTQSVFDQIQKLTKDHEKDAVQANGITRNDTNLHVEPGRDTDHLYQIASGEKVTMLQRATAEKPGAAAPPSKVAAALKKSDKPEPPKVVMEDWWLVKDQHQRIGWVLGRMVDVDVPLDIAQYAEGQRFVAFFTLNEVKDGDKQVPQYLAVLSENKDGQPFDFTQIRVFTWNVKKHRYETAYRERNLNGVLPVTVTHETFDKEGDLPVFIVRVKDDAGATVERKYKLDTPLVHRVLAPGEQPVPVRRASGKRKRSN
jgi:SH3 domain-containing protein